ncbi:redox-sensing transcriptional repressor Rex, partial [Bacillus spizizenii]|nr:redox-sensing transcriptional repressor Rex [Bacillus spizizenii]
VGNLGTAFLHYNLKKNNNTKISMDFDIIESKIGTEVCGVPVSNLDDLEQHVKNESVAIITVPAVAAQSITDRLFALGI